MKLASGYENRNVRMEMISLMDVMFLVLVFFVYSIFSMSVHHGIRVDLPVASGTLEQGEQLVVTITADGALALNNRPLTREALVADVRRLARVDSMPVLISADRTAPIGIGIELLGQLKTAGVEKVTFQVTGD